MLVPALLYKDQIEKEFMKVLYTDDYFYYQGWIAGSILPKIREEENLYQYAIIDKEGKLLGFLSYKVDMATMTAYGFGAYSFDRGSYIVGKDLIAKLHELVMTYHRIEWRAISCNSVVRSYDRILDSLKEFCRDIVVYKTELHDVVLDKWGILRNEIIYEVINKS